MSVSGFASSVNTLTLNLNLNQQQFSLSHLSRELATGLRVSQPGDDPTAFVISTQQQTQIETYDTASENLQNGMNQINVASEALSSVTAIVQHLRTLAIEASSTLMDQAQLAALQLEVAQSNAEINAIAQETSFNQQPIFKGTDYPSAPQIVQSTTNTNIGNVTLTLGGTPTPGNLLLAFFSYGNQNGSNSSPAAVVTPPAGWTQVTNQNNNIDVGYAIYEKTVVGGDPSSYTWGFSPADYSAGILVEVSGADTTNPIDGFNIQYVNGPVDQSPTVTAAQQNDLAFAGFFIKKFAGGATSSGANWSEVALASQAYDTNELQVAAPASEGQLLSAGYTSVDTGRDYGYTSTLLVAPQKTLVDPAVMLQAGFSEGDEFSYSLPLISAANLNIAGIDLTTFTGAQQAMQLYDNTLQVLGDAQSNLGAVSIAMNHQFNLNQLTSLNLTSSLSSLRDANTAQTLSSFTKTQILVHFGTALLAQSNHDASNVLELFR